MDKKDKRGVSTVIATVLMILLVIVGIAVIWTVIKPMIDRSSDEIEGDCFSVRLEPVKCEIDSTSGVGVISTVIKRNSGGGDLQEIKLILTGNIWDSLSYNSIDVSDKQLIISVPNSGSIEELGRINPSWSLLPPVSSSSIYSLVGETGNQIYIPTEINVAPVVGEQNKLCEPLSSPIECECLGNLCPPSS